MGSVLAISVLLISVLLCCAPLAERDGFVFVPQHSTEIRNPNAAFGGGGPDPIVGRADGFLEAGVARIHVAGVVLEPAEINAGERDRVVVGQAEIAKRETAAPIGVPADSHIRR